MKRRFWIGIFASVQIVIIAVIVLLIIDHRQSLDELYTTFDLDKPSAREATVAQLPYQSGSVPTNLGFSRYICAKGRIAPSSNYIKLTPPFVGKIETIHVKEGDSVKKGDVLFTMDTSHLLVRKNQLIADKKAQEAKLKAITATHEKYLNELAQELEENKIKYRMAKNRFQVFEKLIDTSAVSQLEFEEHKNAYLRAKSQFEKIELDIKLHTDEMHACECEMQEAMIARADSMLEEITLNIAAASVTAPVEGVIYQINHTAGEHVAHDTALLMGSESPLHVRIKLSEKDIARMRSVSPRALALSRANPHVRVNLEFVKIQNFYGEESLEAVFAFERSTEPLFVGQLVDVFVEAGEL